MPLRLHDTINLLGKVNFTKAINVGKVLSSYYYSRLTKKPIQKGLPISISIEPTTACNLGCPECPSGLKQFTRATGNINIDLFKKMIDTIASHIIYINFYFQGEPYIHPKFLDMVAYAGSKNIYTSTSTNAHFLDDQTAEKTVRSGLDRLIISIDGTTQEIYEQYRIHGNLNKVLEGAKNIEKWKKKLNSSKPYTIFQFLVVKPNEHQVNDAKRIAKEIGVDTIKFKTAQVYDYEDGNSLIPENEKYSRYKKQKNGKYAIKNKLLNHCWKLWHSCVLTWDGMVVPCCFDKDAKHQMGDLKIDSFENIWQNDRYQNFRTSLLKARNQIDICTNCTEGTKVWA